MTPVPALVPRVLSIAGTDPSGGAGTAADTKSITAAGGYAMAVVTCLVAQSTRGVREVHTPPTAFLRAQLDAVGQDVAIDAVKTGMLGTTEIIETVWAWLEELGSQPAQHAARRAQVAGPGGRPPLLVVDPVMVATSGDRLLEPQAEAAMTALCQRATVITPNIAELAVITGQEPATTAEEALDQARAWSQRTGTDVLVKTGHLSGEMATTFWVGPDGVLAQVPTRRLATTSTHGTGCSLSSALAARLAAGQEPAQALAWSCHWLHEAIAHGAELGVGQGHGPVDHSHRSRRLALAADTAPWVPRDAVPPALEHPDELRAVAGVPGLPSPPAAHPDRAVPPQGPWTRALWRSAGPLIAQIQDSGFVRALVEGTLAAPEFDFYLAQDTHYLARYAKALATVSTRAPSAAQTAQWARTAAAVIDDEAELHRTWLAGRELPAESPVCLAYTDFLQATASVEPYAVAAAALLPCPWLYAHIGAGMPHPGPDHPYAAWLSTYHDPVFARMSNQAAALTEQAMAQATPTERSRAARAFLIACRHELEFFEQARRLGDMQAGGAAVGQMQDGGAPA
ncbi:bifunctional hydroxymethylpyrimidine kinase/phosphomethylpyrimidine kinase [Actinomyces capricornis]|uniref:Bifunctional hydroxymethylpyrimidine kinase/phosphomethylpyrimidine kinase n=1 Tax=Actinomyces capricornis TaxID=2755559 RepID=A0ABN6K5N9_9ACTO|nr:bifunctional hydroxymethylpyrimidine kinase/phosphomethylpyrimidine kinase [Actinomyces capricornis]BDA63384.1 bifunctional hydroxymethylpyrimidine kinase/phosphomethylpyrimidine kinase [Actinomyces capricornis]